MNSLLAEIATQEDIQIQFSHSSYKHNHNRSATFNSSKPSINQSTTNKHCSVCKFSGRRYEGHDVNDCWYLSKIEKLEMAKSLQVTVEHDDV